MKSKLKIQTKTKTLNFKKIAKTRRQRGYQWEDTLVKRFNKMDGWKAFRLGSPSVALPDILSVNNKDSILYTLEAKSGTGTTLTDYEVTIEAGSNIAFDAGGPSGTLKINSTASAGPPGPPGADGNDGADGDDLGSIQFWGNDDGTPSVQQYAGILAEVADASSGAEGGKLSLQVATHDGEIQPGLILTDGSAEDEVDVTIGNGTDSLTTIAGDTLFTGIPRMNTQSITMSGATTTITPTV